MNPSNTPKTVEQAVDEALHEVLVLDALRAMTTPAAIHVIGADAPGVTDKSDYAIHEAAMQAAADTVARDTPTTKQTRAHKRFNERIEREANGIYEKLFIQFQDCFMENKPGSSELDEKLQELDTKWRMYCQRRKIVASAHGALRQAMLNMFTEYDRVKNGGTL